MNLSAILLLVALAVLGYAHSLAPYKDEALFTEQYLALPAGQSDEYRQLRAAMLTRKFQLQDYGGTLLALSVGVFLGARNGWRQLSSPGSSAAFLGLAFAAPVLTAGAYVFDLLQGSGRGEFPHWADSLGIELARAPVLLLVLFVWSGAHLALINDTCRPALLRSALTRHASWWLAATAAIAAAFAAFSAATGQYWYVIPGGVWLYFHASLAASRS